MNVDDGAPDDGVEAPFNTGIAVVTAPDPAVRERTLVVLGPGRGGTSAVAGMLSHLGVFLGDELGRVNYEDLRLSKTVENGDLASAGEVLADYNRRHAVWGWKRPSSFKYLDQIESSFRNPHFICVFRDVAAIASRRELSMGFDVTKSMQGALRAYLKIADFLQRTSRPGMVLSYEKLLSDPGAAAAVLASWALTDDPELVRAAAASVEANPYSYRSVAGRRTQER